MLIIQLLSNKMTWKTAIFLSLLSKDNEKWITFIILVR